MIFQLPKPEEVLNSIHFWRGLIHPFIKSLPQALRSLRPRTSLKGYYLFLEQDFRIYPRPDLNLTTSKIALGRVDSPWSPLIASNWRSMYQLQEFGRCLALNMYHIQLTTSSQCHTFPPARCTFASSVSDLDVVRKASEGRSAGHPLALHSSLPPNHPTCQAPWEHRPARQAG